MSSHEQWRADTLALGRSVAEQYRPGFKVGDHVLGMIEAQALLYYHKHDPDLLLDAALARWTSEFEAWDGTITRSDFR